MHYDEFDCVVEARTIVNGKWTTIARYKNMYEMINCHTEDELRRGLVGFTRYCHNRAHMSNFGRGVWENFHYHDMNHVVEVYNEYDQYYSPSDLVGFRRWLDEDRSHRWELKHFYTPGYKRNRRKGGSYRSMRTTQERRMTCSEEHAPFVRGKRSKRSLPNAWDDYYREHNGNNWKKYRKTQYRPT